MLLDKRVELKPSEYPDFSGYKDAIRHSYWIHTEFNMDEDIQNFRTEVSDSERNAIKNTMLAIAQIEVAVKTFWGDLYHRLPKPEIGAVGFTFAESEVRHQDAYSFLLERLGLNEEFRKIHEIPAMIDRIDYLQEYVSGAKSKNDEEYAMSILMFSIFIEHVSLFSQFLIMMAFNREKNLFRGISNMVEATSKEEQIHGQFGTHVINILQQEYPHWFGENFGEEVQHACEKAYKAENKILDWIFEEGELDFLPKATIQEFLKNRFNNSLKNVGVEPIFEIDETLVDETRWFDEEVIAGKHYDFFAKRPTSYSKKMKSITEDDLF